jgi:hypothetical protein
VTEDRNNPHSEEQTATEIPDWLRAVNVWLSKQGFGEIEFNSISSIFENKSRNYINDLYRTVLIEENDRRLSPNAELVMRVIVALTNVLITDEQRRGPYPELCQKLSAFRESCIALQSHAYGDEGVLARELSHAQKLKNEIPDATVGGLYELYADEFHRALVKNSLHFKILLEQIIRVTKRLENLHRVLQEPAVALKVNSERGDAILNQFCFELAEDGVDPRQIAEIIGELDALSNITDPDKRADFIDAAEHRMTQRVYRFRKNIES